MIIYKNVLEQLAKAGYTTYKIEKEKVISQCSLTRIRKGLPISLSTLDIICRLTGLQPGDLIEYREGSAE